MLEQLQATEINKWINKKIEWNSLPMKEDLKSLLIGTSVFSDSDKEIISMKHGYYKIIIDDFCKNDNIIDKLNKRMNVIIVDGNTDRVFKAAITE